MNYVPIKGIVHVSQDHPSTNGNYKLSIKCPMCDGTLMYLSTYDIHFCMQADCLVSETLDITFRIVKTLG